MMTLQRIIDDTVAKGIWKDGCPVHIKYMRLLDLPYYDFDGKMKTGKMMVLGLIEDRVKEIFDELFRIKFPIEKMNLINEYYGDDEKSMADNNTSAFNCRMIMNTDRYSNHSMGTAIDINPLQNPYITKAKDGSIIVLPSAGEKYLDRDHLHKGMVTSDVVKIFAKCGFTWGGDWQTLKDYQHFELEKTLQQKLFDNIN